AQVEERTAAGERAGEADGLDQRMLHDGLADLAVAALDEREDARMHAGLLDGGKHGLGDDLARARMGGMALDDDGATGRKRGSGVTAGRREGEREVGGAENGDRADRPLDEADLRARRRLAVRQGRIEAAVEIVAVLDMVGEEAELAGGAAALALEAGDRQAGFLRADLGDGVRARLDLVG